ncbi:integrase [Gossypium australe]|uniref:Integrase n=1 Tax=Gossypium australe TaxID=47621 RepID=A0A5B6V987_9ROSI|nr:integrase [Gossypium australe]
MLNVLTSQGQAPISFWFSLTYSSSSMEMEAKIVYISKIVRLHGVLISITSDRDPYFKSWFWRKLHEALGMRLNFNTAFHPQSDE